MKNREQLDAPVRALKELKNPKRHERFRREIDAMRSIGSHPNVVEIIDFGIFAAGKDKPYYVMEVADSSLGDTIERIRGDYDRIFEIFGSICDGVSHLHSKDIVHRDLKPENLLFFGKQVKISDLGLCLVVDEDRLTEQSEAVGPRFYMAPELEDGKCLEVDSRSDVYSLAKVLYFLLSGGKIFAREKFNQPEFCLSKIFDDERFKLFDPVFAKALQIRPYMRYSSVAELARAVDDVVVKFNAHPFSSLLRKFVDPVSAFVGDPKSVVAACNTREIAQLLRLLKKTDPTGEGLASLAGSLDASSVESFLVLLETNAQCLPGASLNAIVTEVLRNEALCSTVIKTSFGQCRWKNFIELGLNTGDQSVLNNIAKNGFFFFRHNQALVGKIVSRIDQLTAEARKDFLMECIFCDFVEKGDVFRLEIAREDLSPDYRELAIAGLAASADEGSFQALRDIANKLINVDEAGAFLRAVTLTPGGQAKIPLLDERINNPNEDVNRLLKVGLDVVAEATRDSPSEIDSDEAEES